MHLYIHTSYLHIHLNITYYNYNLEVKNMRKSLIGILLLSIVIIGIALPIMGKQHIIIKNINPLLITSLISNQVLM